MNRKLALKSYIQKGATLNEDRLTLTCLLLLLVRWLIAANSAPIEWWWPSSVAANTASERTNVKTCPAAQQDARPRNIGGVLERPPNTAQPERYHGIVEDTLMSFASPFVHHRGPVADTCCRRFICRR